MIQICRYKSRRFWGNLVCRFMGFRHPEGRVMRRLLITRPASLVPLVAVLGMLIIGSALIA